MGTPGAPPTQSNFTPGSGGPSRRPEEEEKYQPMHPSADSGLGGYSDNFAVPLFAQGGTPGGPMG